MDTVTCTGVCTEAEVIETINDNDPRNDETEQQVALESVEAKEETFNEDIDTPLPTTVHHTTNQADEHMETSHVSYNLLDISNTPVMVAHATVDFIGQNNNNFLKGCKWYGVHNMEYHCISALFHPGPQMDHASSPVVMIIF